MSLPFCRPFKSVLVANRGEIAFRLVKDVQEFGLRAIAVYSDADRDAPHVRLADTAVHIGPSPAQQSYLEGAKLIRAAKSSGAEAIHPGYGFLAENADFAQAVVDAGLVWIGPPPAAIRAMGDKANAKRIARDAGVPVIPGYDGEDQSDARLANEAERVGLPLMIKATAGGGGRGMRRVERMSDFADALSSARREAKSAFGSDHMILERALDNVRHVEIQILADAYGDIVHMSERDCSVQRRNQKIIEEAPSPAVNAELRKAMGEAAISLARAVGYINAGTVEFLLDGGGNFYFLEMNTRIQVEHPVTEKVLYCNLILLQLELAQGDKAWFDQSRCDPREYAIEVRICAEDAYDGFKPQTGKILALQVPFGFNRRFDENLDEGIEVTQHYDSMLGKLIANGASRDEALRNLRGGLRDLLILGVTTNKEYLLELVEDPIFIAGNATTNWLANRPAPVPKFEEHLAELAALILAQGGSWSSTNARRTIITLSARGRSRTFTIEGGQLNGTRLLGLRPIDQDEGNSSATIAAFARGDSELHARFVRVGSRIDIDSDGHVATFEDVTYAPAEPKDTAGDGAVRAPMAGKIVRANAEAGAKVEKGQVLVILEAMKMEHEITARISGTIASMSAKVGGQVANRQVLATITP